MARRVTNPDAFHLNMGEGLSWVWEKSHDLGQIVAEFAQAIGPAKAALLTPSSPLHSRAPEEFTGLDS